MNSLVLPHTAYADTRDLDAELDAWANYLRQQRRRIAVTNEPGSAANQPSAAQPTPAAAPVSRPADIPAWLEAQFTRNLHPLTRAHMARAWQLQTFTAAQIAADTGSTTRRVGQSIGQLRRKRLLVKIARHRQAVYRWRVDDDLQEAPQQDCA